MVPMVIGNANGTIDSPNGTIGANGKPMVPLVSHWLPMGTIGKITNGTVGRTPNGELYYVSNKGETINYHHKWTFQSIIQEEVKIQIPTVFSNLLRIL